MSGQRQPVCKLKEGNWLDFRESVREVEPELFDIIEQISPDQSYSLIEVTYLYGEKITDLGTICLPDENGHVLRLDDSRLPNHFREQLSYGPTPLILQLTRGSEVFIEAGDRIAPLNVFMPGDLYGLYEAIVPLTHSDVTPCWSVTAGARSIFLGAKVTEAIGHKRLRSEYGTSSEAPKSLSDQWHNLKIIGNRSRVDNPWVCKILLFTKPWFKEKLDDHAWLRFHYFLLKKSWLQSSNSRRRLEYSAMWEAFTSAIRARNLKPGPYIIDTILHLLILANRGVPGFRPADSSELLSPSGAIEYAYDNIYQIKDYAPIIMQPHVLGANNENSIYYSLSYPTIIEGTPSIRHARGTMSELRDIRTLMQALERVLRNQDAVIFESVKNTNYEYYHNEKDKFQETVNTKYLLEHDATLRKISERFKGKAFPTQGPFFRGCIRVIDET